MVVPVIREKVMIVNKNQVKKTQHSHFLSQTYRFVPRQEGKDFSAVFSHDWDIKGF